MAVAAETEFAGCATIGTEASEATGTNVEVVWPRDQNPPTAFAHSGSQQGTEAARVAIATSCAEDPS